MWFNIYVIRIVVVEYRGRIERYLKEELLEILYIWKNFKSIIIRSSMKSKQDKHNEKHKQAHYNQTAENQRWRENSESNKRKMTK